MGSAFGGMKSFAGGCATVLTNPRKMNPFCIPFAITNMSSAMLAMDTGLMGPNYGVNSACATGNYCMLNAVNHIRAGEADMMLAGATDAAILPEGGGYLSKCSWGFCFRSCFVLLGGRQPLHVGPRWGYGSVIAMSLILFIYHPKIYPKIQNICIDKRQIGDHWYGYIGSP